MKISKEFKMFGEMVDSVYSKLDPAKQSNSFEFVEAYYLLTKMIINAFETYILSTNKDHYFLLTEIIRNKIDNEFQKISSKFENKSLEEMIKWKALEQK